MSKTFRFTILSLALVAAVALVGVSVDAAVRATLTDPVFTTPDRYDRVGLPVPGSAYDSEWHARYPHMSPADIKAMHYGFINVVVHEYQDHVVETFDSRIRFDIIGRDELDGLTSVVDIPVQTTVVSTKQQPGTDRRVLDTKITALQGSAADHADFKTFSIVAGEDFGLSSPGTTILTRQTDGTFRVESSFNVNFQVRLEGQAGSAWEGVSDVFTAEAIMEAFDGSDISNGF